MNPDNQNRVMKFIMPIELIANMLTTGNITAHQCVKGLPPGAVYVSHYFDHQTHFVHIVFQHESFPPVDIGGVITNMTITLTNFEIPVGPQAEIPVAFLE